MTSALPQPRRPWSRLWLAENDYSIHLDSVTVKDVNELQRELSSQQRLQMMRYAGRP